MVLPVQCFMSKLLQHGAKFEFHVNMCPLISSGGQLLHHMPLLHLSLASSILCGGLQPSKAMKLFESINVCCIKRREFCNIQSAYVIPAVYRVWKKNQEEVLKDLPGKKVVVASDMRVDSPTDLNIVFNKISVFDNSNSYWTCHSCI